MKKIISLSLNLSLLSLLILAAGCNGHRENDPIPVSEDLLDVALRESVTKVIEPAVEQFAANAINLQRATVKFCDFPTLSRLEETQQSWKLLSQDWFHLAVYNFGSLNDDLVFPKYTFIDSLRLRGTDYIETIRSEIAKNLANDVVLDNTFFDSLTFQKTGLLLIEALLFETSTEQLNDVNDILAEFEFSSRKCSLLTGASDALIRVADYVVDGWQVNYLLTGQSFSSLIINNQLPDDSESLALIFVTIQNYLDYLQKRNVVTVNAKLSGIAWQNITASIDEVELFLNGSEDAETNYLQIMSNAGFDSSVNLINENIQRIRESIDTREAELLGSELGKLDGNFKREIPDALAIELGINFTDGD